MPVLAIFGFLVGCYGVVSWIFSAGDLASQPAVVAVPQLILFALQALLGFLLTAVAGGSIGAETRLRAIEVAMAAGIPAAATRKPCPDCAEQVLYAARVCRYCRHEFWADGGTPVLPPPLPAEPDTSIPLWIKAVAAVLILIFVVALLSRGSLHL
jgi:hypothetical protein